MKKLCSLALLTQLLGCGAQPADGTPPRIESTTPADLSHGDAADAGPLPDSSPPAVLAARVDIDLKMREPTLIPGWDVVATVTDASLLSKRSPSGRRACVHVAEIRFQRGDEEPIELRFGPPEKRVHTLYGHSVAVWGATTLTVYPPGMRAWP